ncbi:hypothetical protein RCL1_003096 [Eukaryota sp. TZLM3-RCL]
MYKRKDFISQLELNSSRPRVSIRITAAQFLKFTTIPEQLQIFSNLINPAAVTSVSLDYSLSRTIKVPTSPTNSLFPFPNLETLIFLSTANVEHVFKVVEEFSLPGLKSLTIRLSYKYHVNFHDVLSHIKELNIIESNSSFVLDLSKLVDLKTLSVVSFNKTIRLTGFSSLANLENLDLVGYNEQIVLHPSVKLLNLKVKDVPNCNICSNNLTELQTLTLIRSGLRICQSLSTMPNLESIIIDFRKLDRPPSFKFNVPFLPKLQHLELYKTYPSGIDL